MKKKLFFILTLFLLSILVYGCGKEEAISPFAENFINQGPINVSNPITEVDDFVEDLKVVETDISLYYDRYLPDENTYIPTQMANTSYNFDDNGNSIPSSLFQEDFSRENLRNINFLIDDYHIANKYEFNFNYYWKNNNEKLPKNYSSLNKNISIIGKYKSDEDFNFDDLIIESQYNFSNCNTPENFSVYLYNLKDTKDGIDKSKQILSNMLPEDMYSFLLNSPNEISSDTIQSFNGSLDTEDKNSHYSFYREFKTPLKDSAEKPSVNFNLRFLDSLSQRQLKDKTVINQQSFKFKSQDFGLDWGDIGNNRNFNIDNSFNCFQGIYKAVYNNDYKFLNSYKDYENLKYTIFDETTNLNPADIIKSYQEYSYDTHIVSQSNYRDKNGINNLFNSGNTYIKYDYKKNDYLFSSINFNLEDIFVINKDSDFTNINQFIKNRIQLWLINVDLNNYSFNIDENTIFFDDINGLRCKISIIPTYEESKDLPDYFRFKINIKIESDDIYGIASTDIVSEHDDVEYDVEGNIIEKDKEEEVKTEEIIEEFEIDEIVEESNFEEEIEEVIDETEVTETETKILNEEENDDSSISGGSLDDLL